jgi:GNAT superfamily N-acetyltransferase
MVDHVQEIAGISNRVALTPVHPQRSFLGCPLSVAELRERFEFFDICFLIFLRSDCVGYCLGYSAGGCFGRAINAANERGWREKQLFDHIPPSFDVSSGCVFQVAVVPERHGLGFGRHLVEQATLAALDSCPSGTIFAFVPEVPANLFSRNLALRLGYITQELFLTEHDKTGVTRWRLMSNRK